MPRLPPSAPRRPPGSVQRLAEQFRDLLVDGSAGRLAAAAVRRHRPSAPTVEAASASDELVPIPTLAPFTTMTRFQLGDGARLGGTHIDRLHVQQRVVDAGSPGKSPNTTVEPPEPSSVRSLENSGPG